MSGNRERNTIKIHERELRMMYAEHPDAEASGEMNLNGEILKIEIVPMTLEERFPRISDFGLLQRIHPGHALTYLRTDRDEAGKRIGRVLGWEDGRMVAIREDGAAVEIHGS